MSVLKSKRGESNVEFLDVARRLEIETLQFALKLPKRLTFFLSTEIMRWGSTVYNEVKAANSVYATNQHEAQIRRDHFIEANNALQILDGKISLAYDTLLQNPDLFGEGEQNRDKRKEKTDKGRKRLGSSVKVITALINEEAGLISKIKDSDRRRSKTLPQ